MSDVWCPVHLEYWDINQRTKCHKCYQAENRITDDDRKLHHIFKAEIRKSGPITPVKYDRILFEFHYKRKHNNKSPPNKKVLLL